MAGPEEYRIFAKINIKKLFAEGFTYTCRWKDIGEFAETDKVMQFWIKSGPSHPDESEKYKILLDRIKAAPVVAGY